MILLVSFSCSEDKIVNAPVMIDGISWYKYFDEDEVKKATGGLVNTSGVYSMEMTYNIKGSRVFEVEVYINSSNGSFFNKLEGSYVYNSNTGRVIFTYDDVSVFGRNSDTGIVNEDEMTLQKTYIFEEIN